MLFGTVLSFSKEGKGRAQIGSRIFTFSVEGYRHPVVDSLGEKLFFPPLPAEKPVLLVNPRPGTQIVGIPDKVHDENHIWNWCFGEEFDDAKGQLREHQAIESELEENGYRLFRLIERLKIAENRKGRVVRETVFWQGRNLANCHFARITNDISKGGYQFQMQMDGAWKDCGDPGRHPKKAVPVGVAIPSEAVMATV